MEPVDHQAHRLVSLLGLADHPIALAWAEEAPPGVLETTEDVPSLCTLWRRAEEGVFYAPASKQLGCPVGGMIMGFELDEFRQEQLGSIVGFMSGCGYLRPEEASRIPTANRRAAGIVYGPLGGFPLQPDLVLAWVKPQQAMLCGEAVGGCRWTETDPTAIWGRPACAALPIALNHSRATLSLGCMGMREFTQVADDKSLLVIPGAKVADFIQALTTAVEANRQMREFYQQHRSHFKDALQPTH